MKRHATKINKLTSLTEPVKEELLEVWEKAVRNSHHFLTEQDLNYYRSRVKNVYLQTVEIHTIKKQRRIVAFMGLSDEMVEMLFVLPPKQGNGYGSALLDFALTEKHINKIDVNEQNTEALHFYLHRGYKVKGRDETDADGKTYPILHIEK